MPRLLQQLQGQGPSQGGQHAGNSLIQSLLPSTNQRNRQPLMGENLQKDLNMEEIKLAAKLWEHVIDTQMVISQVNSKIYSSSWEACST